MKRLILSILFLFSIVVSYSQTQIDTKRVIARDSLKLQTDWFRLTNPANGQILIRENGRWVNTDIAAIDSLDFIDEQTLAIDSALGAIGITISNGNRIHFNVGGEIVTDITLTGNGTVATPAKVDTTVIATVWYVDQQIIAAGGYTDEKAQDAVGAMIDNGTVGDIVFNYDDVTPKLSGTVEDDSHNHIIANVDNLQDSLLAKQKLITGAATTVTTSNLAGSSVLVSTSGGKIAAAASVSATEVGYLDGVTSPIQTQLNFISANYVDTIFAEQDSVFPIEHLKYMIGSDTTYISSYAKPNGLIIGGNVSWESGLIFNVSSSAYFLGGEYYSTLAAQVTLDASDNDSNRIDVIVVDTTGAVDVIKGTNAVSPQKPTVDPTYQIELTNVLILANATEPGDPNTGDTIRVEMIYNENVEWTGSGSGVTVDFDGTTLPYNGSKVADVGTLTNYDAVKFTSGQTISKTEYQTLSFAIKLKSAWNKQVFSVMLGNGTVSATEILAVNIDKTSTAWQVITINLSDFFWRETSFDYVAFLYNSSQSVSGYYLDFVQLQGGVDQPVLVESQTLSTNGTAGNISISGGNTITLNVNDADFSATNEIQAVDTFRIVSDMLQISLLNDGVPYTSVGLSSYIDDLSGIRDTLQFHRDSLLLAFDSIAEHNLRLIEVEGLDTTGVYHANRALLNSIDAADTTRWAGCNYATQTLNSTSDTLVVANGVNGILDISGNTTIRIEPTATCNTGNITVICEAAADSITFTGATMKISPYLGLANGKIPVTNSATGYDCFSWWYDGTRIFINGTKAYE